MIRAVIFDMDGVLADSEYAYLQRITSLLQEEGFNIEFSQVCPVAGTDDASLWEMLGEILHTTFDFQKMMHKLESYVARNPISYPELLNAGVKEILSRLHAEGYQLALASSSRMAHIQEMLSSCQISKYFTHVLSGEMFEKTKPDPAIYLKAIQLLECRPEEIIVIEDSKYGIAAAKGASLYTMAKKEERFFVDQQQADVVFQTFEDAYDLIKKRSEKYGK